ncbi:ATP-binding cassette domain-containing protein, partial [Verrucomicrobia bacterium]|nr:ATP-binding cassette domain-containing protein [Verrucomicrobiota bacterium]
MDKHGATPLLEVGQVTKQFPGVLALRGVDLTLYRGEVLAVIGENGAGKSTLMKILAGVQPADSGEICIDGQRVQYQSVREALAHGVALIHQELNLADNLDVGANIFLGREPL